MARAKSASPKKPAARKAAPKATPQAAKTKAVLLSGGNPQIAKGDGDEPVQAWIEATPGWKQAAARRLDALITRAVPKVRKAVKWNSPFYGAGLAEEGWFASLHIYANFVRVAFFRGARLDPVPPGPSKIKDVRYFDLREGALDEAGFTAWVKQAAKLPGTRM